jgi:hypothetical protein
MTRRWWVVVVLALVWPSVMAAQNTSFVSIERDGKPAGGFGPRSEPHPFDAPFPTSVYFWDQPDLHDARGRAITGLGFWATRTGDAVRVTAYLLVPAPGSPNRYLAQGGDDTRHMTRGEALATYTLSVGQHAEIVELKSIGAKPVTIRILAEMPPAIRVSRPSN